MSVIEDYTIGNRLGSGLTSEVRKATAADGRELAIKIIDLDSLSSNSCLEMISFVRNEMHINSMLDDDSIVRALHSNEHAILKNAVGDRRNVAYIT